MGWERTYFSRSDDKVFAFFVIFGDFDEEVEISASEYNFTELPENTSMTKFHDDVSPEYRDGFRAGYLWDELKRDNPELVQAIEAAPGCIVIHTELEDQETLDYLRNLVGIVTYFLDNGGVSVYDPQRFKWWSPQEWHETIFAPMKDKQEVQVYHHSIILVSKQDDGKNWYHTRGLRLFARPDISVHDVTDEYAEKILEMINRFIALQALGEVIADGQQIEMEGLPDTMWCEHKGSLEDPEFNNKHVEIQWE